MHARGFTIVELIITITIMGILLVLTVVNVSSTQVNARDTEREGDVKAIAANLESFYSTDNSLSANLGVYPSTSLPNGTVDYMQQMLRDVDIKSLRAPGVTDPKQTFIAATNNGQTVSSVAPQPTISQYVYQPLDANGALCASSNCRKFNIYYRLEKNNTVYMITSKNQ